MPGVFADSAPSANDTTPLKTVSRDCTSGRVYGAGASIQGGFGDVVINTVGGSTLSGSATIYERGTAISGNHQVRAFGTCAS